MPFALSIFLFRLTTGGLLAWSMLALTACASSRPPIVASIGPRVVGEVAVVDEEKRWVLIAGPVCESSDTFGINRRLSRLESGDLVAILNAGAYGAAMSSNYNTRLLLPEILVAGNQFKTIRERQSFEEIVALERY